MRRAAPACAAALAACAAIAPGAPLEVREVARGQYCNTPGDATAAGLLPDAAAVLELQAVRGIALLAADAIAPAPHALVETGLRSTGGYAVAVEPAATIRDGHVVLIANFTQPAPGSLRTQALSSPCVLVQLPPGDYAGVEVRDAGGAVRAHGGRVPLTRGSSGPDR